jgi:hypothetical protein
MKKVQNILLVLTFLTLLNQTYVRAENSPPELPVFPDPIHSNIPSSKNSLVIKKPDVHSGLGQAIVAMAEDKEDVQERHNMNVLLLESVLFHSNNIKEPLKYIGSNQDTLNLWNPKLYNIVNSIPGLEESKSGDINRFLQTNFKTEYLSSELFNKKNSHLAKPIYMSEVVNWAFDAVAVGDIDSTRILLDNYDFLLTIKSDDGYGLLSYSILHGRNDIAYMLVYRGANLNEENKYMANPMNIAARTNNIEAIKLLLDNGCKINHQDAFGKTALDYALMNNNQEMYNYLLKSSQ